MELLIENVNQEQLFKIIKEIYYNNYINKDVLKEKDATF